MMDLNNESLNQRWLLEKAIEANTRIFLQLEKVNVYLKTEIEKHKRKYNLLKNKTLTDSSDSDNDDVEENSFRVDLKDENIKNHTFYEYENTNSVMVTIGPHTKVRRSVLKSINWNSYTHATRKILMDVFSRRVLATHSLTGKLSPAFPDRPVKKKLDSNSVNDIVDYVVERCPGATATAVRTIITIKCADEAKILRIREKKCTIDRKRSCSESSSDDQLSPSSDEAMYPHITEARPEAQLRSV